MRSYDSCLGHRFHVLVDSMRVWSGLSSVSEGAGLRVSTHTLQLTGRWWFVSSAVSNM